MRFANIFETIHGQVLVHIVSINEVGYAMVVAFQPPGRESPSSVSVNFTSGTHEVNWSRVCAAFAGTTLEVAEELVGNVIKDFGSTEPKKDNKPRIHLLS